MPLPRSAATALTAALAGILAAVTACSSSGTSSPGRTSRPAVTTSRAAAGVGATRTLHGTGGQQFTVRLDQIRAAVTATDGKPPTGRRYFAAQLTVTNTGTARLAEGPWISTTVTDRAGQQYDPAEVTGTAAGPELPGEIKTPGGATRTGWIVFDVPAAAIITGLEYGAAGGIGDTADWAF